MPLISVGFFQDNSKWEELFLTTSKFVIGPGTVLTIKMRIYMLPPVHAITPSPVRVITLPVSVGALVTHPLLV